MAKLIDKIKVGMSMEEVRKIIPYKPDLIISRKSYEFASRKNNLVLFKLERITKNFLPGRSLHSTQNNSNLRAF
jgi:hypothetical protein